MAFQFDKVSSFLGGDRSVAKPDRFHRPVEARTRVAWLLGRLGEVSGLAVYATHATISKVFTLKFGGLHAVDSSIPFGSLPSCLPFKQLWPTT